jgi:hypothetical protein
VSDNKQSPTTVQVVLNDIDAKVQELMKSGRGGKDFQQMVSAIDLLRGIVGLQELRLRDLESKHLLTERTGR